MSVVYSERLPFISQGDAYMDVGSPTGGPNDVVQNNVLFIHYGVAGKGDLLLLMSRRCLVGDDARRSQWRRLPCSYMGYVACGVSGMMEKCRAVVSN